MLLVLHRRFNAQQKAAEKAITSRKSIGANYRKKDWLNDSMNWDDEDQALSAAVAPLLYTLMTTTGRDAMNQVAPNQTFNTADPNLLSYYQRRADKIATDVNDETEKQLRAALSQGQSNGDTDDELLAAISLVFGAALTYRSDRIARTEVTRAQGKADIVAWQQSGVVYGKEWFTVEDERVCPFCQSLDGKVIPLDTDFATKGDVLEADGKTLNVSYDDIPAAPCHANCRCRLIPTVLR